MTVLHNGGLPPPLASASTVLHSAAALTAGLDFPILRLHRRIAEATPGPDLPCPAG